MTNERSIGAGRCYTVAALFIVGAVVLGWRVIDLQIVRSAQYQTVGNAIQFRDVPVSAHRGMLTDRNGDPLAVSAPLASVSVNPRQFNPPSAEHFLRLAAFLDYKPHDLRQRIERNGERGYLVLRRQITPEVAQAINQLGLPGVQTVTTFKRFYPAGEVTAQVVGMTNSDDVGVAGIERTYEPWLRGEPGEKRVVVTGRNNNVRDIASIRAAVEGKDVQLSLDKRLQYLAYRALKSAVTKHSAAGGMVVLVDALTGEILAMVNQPSFNPNAFLSGDLTALRNRAAVDLFEPGSTMKPFVIAAALERGRISPRSEIDTTPGFIHIGGYQISDKTNLGIIDIGTLIQKSSNVGVVKVALQLSKEYLYERLFRFGFGTITETGLPGESAGRLPDFQRWTKTDHAAVSYGYGISTTALQLARAYSVLARDGIAVPLSLQKLVVPPKEQRVFSQKAIKAVRVMMERVVSTDGTAPLARVPGYRVAGKTGTVRKHIPQNGNGHRGAAYSTSHYHSLFAGFAPASNPRLVAIVVVDDANKGKFYGGDVAAPVFAEVMSGALRLMAIPPDDIESLVPALQPPVVAPGRVAQAATVGTL